MFYIVSKNGALFYNQTYFLWTRIIKESTKYESINKLPGIIFSRKRTRAYLVLENNMSYYESHTGLIASVKKVGK